MEPKTDFWARAVRTRKPCSACMAYTRYTYLYEIESGHTMCPLHDAGDYGNHFPLRLEWPTNV